MGVVNQFGKSMKKYSFALHLVMLIVLIVSMNACMIANYQMVVRESNEERDYLALKYADPVYFVIPLYDRITHCGWLQTRCHQRYRQHGDSYRDSLGIQIQSGVSVALDEMLPGKQVEFTEHIPSQGLVCVVTVENQLISDPSYSELLSAVTLFVVPSYTTRKYVLSYSLFLDFRKVREYQYDITEKSIMGIVSWMLSPVVYPFWRDIELNGPYHGPRARVIKEATRTFLLEAHRDGIL